MFHSGALVTYVAKGWENSEIHSEPGGAALFYSGNPCQFLQEQLPLD
jgi:hypothetical protein